MNKPPLGLTPKYIRDLQRLREIQGAIARYYDAEIPIPLEWVKEYNQLVSNKKEAEHGVDKR